MQNTSAGDGMRLGDYFKVIGRHWLVVCVCLLLGVGLAVAYLELAPPAYEATTAVLVMPTDPTAPAATKSAINMDTEAQLVTSTDTLAAVAKRLHLSATDASTLPDNVSVTVPPNSQILDITYTGPSAKDAVDGATQFAQAYLDQRKGAAQVVLDAEKTSLTDRIKSLTDSLNAALKTASGLTPGSADRARADSAAAQLNGQLSTLNSQLLKVNTETITPGDIVNQATTPDSPSSPNPLIALPAGLLLGLIVGLALAALRHRADDVIRGTDDLYRRTGVPVATVLSTRLQEGQVALLPPLSADGRGYARLRNLVTTSLESSDRHVVLVAGVRRGAGPVAANLAASLARAGEEVVLVCADVFNNTASALLTDAPGEGLAEVLAGERDVDTVLRRVGTLPGLRLLGAGQDAARADALLQTRSLRTLIDRLLEGGATYVVVEAPATTDSPDAQTLASGADIAVLVVEAGTTTAREVVDAGAQLESMGAPVLGAVIGRYGRDTTDRLSRRAGVREKVSPAAADDEEDATPRTEAAEVALPAGPTPSGANGAPVAPPNGTVNGNGHAPTETPRAFPPGARGPAPR